MASAELSIYLDGTPIGSLTQRQGGALAFEYLEPYRNRDDATPLSLSIPLTAPRARTAAIRAFIAGLLPDSEAALEKLARRYQVSPRNPFALVSAIGRDVAGAVQALPPGQPSPDADHREHDITWLSEDDLNALLTDLERHPAEWGARTSGRWSLAGAQSKVALYRSKAGRWGIPRDSTPTTHILKPSMPNYPRHHLNEHLCMRAAQLVGLPAANTTLLNNELHEALVVERFDRLVVNGRLSRLHQEDLCQAMSIEPRMKYQSDGGPSVRQIAELFRRALPVANRDSTARTLFDYLVYNVAVGATDAHAKNFGVLLFGKEVRLAPLYDVASIFPTDAAAGPTSAMSIGRHWRLEQINIADWAETAAALGLSRQHASERVPGLHNDIKNAIHVAAEEEAVPDRLRDHARQLAGLVQAHIDGRRDAWGTLSPSTPRR